VYVFKREGHEIKKTFGTGPKILSAPIIQISASQIRDHIRTGKSIRYLVPEVVREEIESRRFYKQRD
jgi:nicotinate-nucleotide adenylyltransferase